VKKHIEGMVFVGWVLLAIAFVIDDLSTLILMNMGFEALEANPLYQGLPVMIIFFGVGLLIYGFVGWALYFVVKKYRRLFKNRLKGYKTYDFFVFFFCLMLSFIIVIKISAGMGNLATLGVYSTDEGKLLIDENIEKIEHMKAENPAEYKSMMSQYYKQAVFEVSYVQMLIIGMLAYFLYRIGIGVRPSGLD